MLCKPKLLTNCKHTYILAKYDIYACTHIDLALQRTVESSEWGCAEKSLETPGLQYSQIIQFSCCLT